MPSIELVCVGQEQPLQFQNLPFAVESEGRLISHRTPSPLFKTDFDALSGCIYHLGNPNLRDPTALSCYTALDLLKRERGSEWWNIIDFDPEFVPSINDILERLIDASPIHRVLFTSDYQLGPDAKRYKRPLTLERFWQIYHAQALKMNALYPLRA